MALGGNVQMEGIVDTIKTLVWQSQWDTGVASIDNQHKKILQAIKALNRTFDAQTDQPLVEKLFTALEAYAALHFKFEETVMEKINYLGLAEQKKEHRTFIEHINRLHEESKDPKAFDVVLPRAQSYLMDWLLNHILEVDSQYKASFQKAGVK